MNAVKCVIEGCESVFRTNESVAPNARFICKNHPRSVQVGAVGRQYDEKKDEADKEIRFQDHQFDKSDDLNGAGVPEGTSHIPFQGSRIQRGN